jgi:hypothetical protein
LGTGTQRALETVQENGAIRSSEPPVQLTRTATRPVPSSAQRRLNPWFLSPAVFVSAAIVTFLLFFLRTGSVTASTPPPNPLFDSRNANLQMRVETDGPGLLLSWNRYSRTVQAASSALLAIQDGPQHRDIALDRNQILTGSVFYRPASDDVSFRLELRDARGSNVSQILRVLDAAPRHPPTQPILTDAKEAPARAHREERPRESTVKPAPPQHASAAAVEVASAALPPSNPGAKPAMQTPAPPKTSDPIPSASQSPPPPPQVPLAAAPSDPPIQSAAPSLAPSTVTPQPAAAPTPAQAKDLPAYLPPRPLKWMQPNWPMPQPLDVRVKVRIDENGRVTAAHALMDGATRDKKVLGAAAAAVRQWTFQPAKAHGANVPCEETIVIHFGPQAQ